MAYGTKLLIGKKYIGNDNALDIFVLIKLPKVGTEIDDLMNILLRKESETEYPPTYYYDENLKKIKEDKFGDELRLVPIRDILNALIIDNFEEPKKVFNKAISLVKQSINEFGEGNAFGILYGY